LFEGSNASPVCPSGNGNTLMKMSLVHWLNGTGGKTKIEV